MIQRKLITETEKKKILVEILDRLDTFFKENSITYYLAYGTLLGAIRHKGFIPWDDDVDLLLPRESFVQLLHLCEEKQEELKEIYLEIVEYGANKKDYYKRFKIADTRTVMEEFGEERSACFVDIFPLDCIKRNTDFRKLRKQKKQILWLDNLCSLCHSGMAQGAGIKRKVYTAILGVYRLWGLKRVQKVLEKKLLYITQMKENGIMCASESGEGDRDFFDVDFSEVTKVSFEGGEYNAPMKWHEVLKTSYGDYMQLPPEEERHAHEYYSMYWR